MPNLIEYTEQVVTYLEYLNYPDYVVGFFRSSDVAMSIAKTVAEHYMKGDISYRLCAIIIFSMTMNYQVIPSSKKEKVH